MIIGPILILAGYACLYMAAGWKITIAFSVIHAGDYILHYHESIIDERERSKLPPTGTDG